MAYHLSCAVQMKYSFSVLPISLGVVSLEIKFGKQGRERPPLGYAFRDTLLISAFSDIVHIMSIKNDDLRYRMILTASTILYISSRFHFSLCSYIEQKRNPYPSVCRQRRLPHGSYLSPLAANRTLDFGRMWIPPLHWVIRFPRTFGVPKPALCINTEIYFSGIIYTNFVTA